MQLNTLKRAHLYDVYLMVAADHFRPNVKAMRLIHKMFP